jgi:hypothetical protein
MSSNRRVFGTAVRHLICSRCQPGSGDVDAQRAWGVRVDGERYMNVY